MSPVSSNRGGGQQLDSVVYFGLCIDSADPLRAGRILAFDDVSFGAQDAAKNLKLGVLTQKTRTQIYTYLFYL